MKEDRNGWSDVPALEQWTCPECKQKSSVDDWKETWVECETCGDHEARECPNCKEAFDHVFGAARIAQESVENK